MRLRTELVAAAALVGTLAFGAAALGARHARTGDDDRRRSTFLAGPSGARGYAEALELLGVRVERFRRPPRELASVRGDSTVLAVLGPTQALDVRDARALVAARVDLLLAGMGATAAFRCLGYEWRPQWDGPGRGARGRHDSALGPRGDSAQGVSVRPGSVPGIHTDSNRLDSILRIQADSVRSNPVLRVGPTDSLWLADSIRRADSVRRAEGARVDGVRAESVRLDSDSVLMSRPFGGPFSGAIPGVLVARPNRTIADSSRGEDAVTVTCTGPVPLAVDTLRRVPQGLVAVRLRYAGGRTVVLVADDRLFTNRALRRDNAGPFALGLVIPRYQRLVVDEYHHGFAQSGSLAGALGSWSVRSPWGWAAWQLLFVGIVALLASGVRFGPIRQVIDRRRRSPLEHVRALATVLAAARGHEVAVTLMVRGLRRRLSRAGHTGRAARGGEREWLEGLDDAVRTPEGRRALDTLRELTGRSAGAARTQAQRVQRAAHAVEDVWEALSKPS